MGSADLLPASMRPAVLALLLAVAAAPAGAQTFDFESLPVGRATPIPLTVGGVFAGFSTSLGPAGAYTIQNSPFVTLTGRVLQQTSGTPAGLFIQFLGAPITGVSLRFATVGSATLTMEVLTPFTPPGAPVGVGPIGVLAATVTARGVVPAGGSSPEGTISYAGVPVFGIRLSAPALLAVDDLQVTRAAVVPEPSGVALVASGVAGIAALARRRRPAARA